MGFGKDGSPQKVGRLVTPEAARANPAYDGTPQSVGVFPQSKPSMVGAIPPTQPGGYPTSAQYKTLLGA